MKTLVKASHSKVDWSSIRSHTKQNSVSCANTKDVVEVSRTKGTSTDICTVMRMFGLNATSCPYKNKDKRNRDSHMRTHQEKGIGLERYHCECCGKVMWFSTQLKHHRVTRCDVLDLHVETSKGDSKTP